MDDGTRERDPALEPVQAAAAAAAVERDALRRGLLAMVEQICCPDAREAMIGARRLEVAMDEVLVHVVRQARRRGYPWARIGRLLGRSRQAMRQRFADAVPEPAPQVSARELHEQHRAYVHGMLGSPRP